MCLCVRACVQGFAASFSIVTSCILCYFFFDFKPNGIFLIGAVSESGREGVSKVVSELGDMGVSQGESE